MPTVIVGQLQAYTKSPLPVSQTSLRVQSQMCKFTAFQSEICFKFTKVELHKTLPLHSQKMELNGRQIFAVFF